MDSKKGLFSFGDVRNHPHRSGFDLSNKHAFTAKAGELLPVYWKPVLPGDKFNFKYQHFSRTMPVQSSAYTRIREYFDWFYVPYRLINRNIGQALVQMQNNPVQATSIDKNRVITDDLIYTNLNQISSLLRSATGKLGTGLSDIVNQFGFKVSSQSAKLVHYLRYGSFIDPTAQSQTPINLGITANEDQFRFAVNVNVNLMPFFAYQKIYYDHFRFQQWENNEPFCYNADYYSGGDFFSSLTTDQLRYNYMDHNNVLTLRYANWHKDMFMGVMPSAQLGSVATVQLDSASIQSLPVVIGPGTVTNATSLKNSPVDGNFIFADTSVNRQVAVGTSTNPTYRYPLIADASQATLGSEFSVIQLRLAEATQRWKEISQCADQTYRDQIYAHFGVRLSQALADESSYIGGSVSNFDISEVVNQTFGADSTSNPDVKGKGVGTGYGSEFFECPEHGIIMCIYHAAPILDYVLSGPDINLLATSTTDIPIPEYDSIGMESLPMLSLLNSYNVTQSQGGLDLQNSILGYVPRYIGYKTSLDHVSGAFVTTLKQWVTPLDPDYLSHWFGASLKEDGSGLLQLNANFFKINPSMLNKIFGVDANSTWDTDQFLVNAFFDVKPVRNLDYSGMPY